MSNTAQHDKLKIEELEKELEQAKKREHYYKDIAKLAGRKRVLEIRELSELVSQYRADQELLSANSEKLEALVGERTQELETINLQLRQIIAEQKQTQKQLELVVELDHVILDISSEFINQPAHKIDYEIKQALHKIGHYTAAHRVSLYILAEKSDTILNTHEWKSVKAANNNNDFHDAYFPQYLEHLKNKKDVIISTIDDLKTLCNDVQHHIDQESFHSLLAVPMMQRGQIYGALFLYGEHKKITSWPQERVTFVKIISDVLVNALERKLSELKMRDSEERYRDLVEKAGLAIALDAEDGSFHYFNKRFADLFGYSEKEIADRKMKDLIHPDDVERVLKNHHGRFNNKNVPTRYEFRGVRKNGDIIYLEVDVVALAMKNKTIATRSYIWDVSHRVQAERAVLESEERYRNLVENFQDIVVIVNLDREVLYVNPAFEKQTGFQVKDLKKGEKTNIYLNDPKEFYDLLDAFSQDDNQVRPQIEKQFQSKEGSLLYYSIGISKITYEQKPALQLIAHNITDEKNAEFALKRSAEFERTVSEVMSQFLGSHITDDSIQNALRAIALWSRAGRATIYRIIKNGQFISSMYEWCDNHVSSQKEFRQNVAIENLSKWDDILNEHGLIHIADMKKMPDDLQHEQIIGQSGDVQSFLFLPFRVQNRTYGAISLEDTHMTDRWSTEDIKLLRLSSEIIGNAFERIEAEKMLRRSEEQYRTLFESSNDEIYVNDFDDQLQPSRFRNVNEAACARLGYSKEELLAMNPFDINVEENHLKINAHAKEIFNNKHFIFETAHRTKDGSIYPVEVSSHLIEIEGRPMAMSIVRDTTERKRIEEEVQKSQRLESIGVLAGGIAHDFNNLLSIILGNAQLAKMMSAQGKDISKFLNNIEEGAGQASTLTRQLLTFSKGGEPIREVYPLPDLIKNAVQLALSGLDEHATFDFSPDLYNAKVDKGQLHQVIHNLILNSDQAMPNGGLIEVSGENVHSDQIKALRRINPGHYVRIRIRDHGIGIKESEQSKIFDPYYTTKEKGNGLGLTVAYSIIKKHDGLLLLNSVPGDGTTADIYLPAIQQQQSRMSSGSLLQESYNGIAYVMDDEALVLDVADEMLREIGFEVERAMNGEELLQLYQAALTSGKKPDILIMDLTVPAGMGGMEAIQKLKKLDPDVKAIVSSGYSNNKIMSHYQQFGFAGVVAKPYTLEDLRRAIGKVLKN